MYITLCLCLLVSPDLPAKARATLKTGEKVVFLGQVGPYHLWEATRGAPRLAQQLAQRHELPNPLPTSRVVVVREPEGNLVTDPDAIREALDAFSAYRMAQEWNASPYYEDLTPALRGLYFNLPRLSFQDLLQETIVPSEQYYSVLREVLALGSGARFEELREWEGKMEQVLTTLPQSLSRDADRWERLSGVLKSERFRRVQAGDRSGAVGALDRGWRYTQEMSRYDRELSRLLSSSQANTWREASHLFARVALPLLAYGQAEEELTVMARLVEDEHILIALNDLQASLRGEQNMFLLNLRNQGSGMFRVLTSALEEPLSEAFLRDLAIYSHSDSTVRWTLDFWRGQRLFSTIVRGLVPEETILSTRQALFAAQLDNAFHAAAFQKSRPAALSGRLEELAAFRHAVHLTLMSEAYLYNAVGQIFRSTPLAFNPSGIRACQQKSEGALSAARFWSQPPVVDAVVFNSLMPEH